MKFLLLRDYRLLEKAIAALFVGVFITGCTLAGWKASLHDQLNYDHGIAMHPELDLRWLRERATANDPYAQTRLASLYYLGAGVAEDKQEASRLFEKAAQGGVTKAQYCIGCMYLDGEIGKKDRDRALYWLKMATTGSDNYADYAREKIKNEPGWAETGGKDADIVKK